MSRESPQARMPAEDRRKQLIETAIELFSRRGFSGTTTKEIAAAAGVTEAIIFRHFATKQDFYKAILDFKCVGAGNEQWLKKWMADVQVFMDADDDAGLFRFIVKQIIGFDRDEPQFARLLMHAALEGHELAIMHNDQMKRPVGEKFREYICRRQKAGAIRECDPSVVLFAIAGIAQYYGNQKYLFNGGDLPYADEKMIDGFVAIVLDGVRVHPTQSSIRKNK